MIDDSNNIDCKWENMGAYQLFKSTTIFFLKKS